MEKISRPTARPLPPGSPALARGFTVIEVIFSLFIFLMMIMMFSAIVPTAARSARYANSYGVATAICQRKLDQLAEAGFGKLNPPGTDLLALGIIDSSSPTSDGTAKIYSFTDNNSDVNANNPDNLYTYFPGGKTGAARATGTIRIDQWDDGQGYTYISGNPNPQVVLYVVTVTVSWRDAAGAPQSLSMRSLIPRVSLS